MNLLSTDLQAVEAIVLSHAHMDHVGGLFPLLKMMDTPSSLIVHPYAFEFPRTLKLKNGKRVAFPRTLIREQLASANVTLTESNTPTPIADGAIVVTGQVERVTEFEKGLPNVFVGRDGGWEPDHIWDDQSIVLLNSVGSAFIFD